MRTDQIVVLVSFCLGFFQGVCRAVDDAPSRQTSQSEFRVLQDRPDRRLVVLPNRLIVVVQELHAAPVVSVQVHVKTGSIYETFGERVGAGMSHFLEHLVSGGTTTTRTEEQSNAILGRIGASTNASTSLDKVRYYVNTTSAHASEAIELMSDWLQHSQIAAEEFHRERDVIQAEFEMGLGEPARIFWKLTQQARFQMHPARHPTIGYIDEFLKITREDIADFYRRMYVPNNMVFLVVGDVDRHQVVEQIAGLWSNSSARDLPTLQFPVEMPILEPRSLSGIADIDKPRLRLAWPGTKLAAEGDYALDLLAVILGQGESSRLVRAVRDEHRAVNRIDAHNSSFSWGEGFFSVDAEVVGGRSTSEAALEHAKMLILDQVMKVREEGVTTVELERAKRKIMANTVYNAQSASALAGRLSHGLIDMGDPDYLDRYAQGIEAIGAEALRVAADRFLGRQRLITITLAPAPEGRKPEALRRPLDATVPADAKLQSVHLDNRYIVERLQAAKGQQEDEAGPIITVPVQRVELSNGMKVLIGRSTLVPAVAVQMYQPGGLLGEEPGREGVAMAVAKMRVRGTTTRTAQQIARETEQLGAILSTDSGYNTGYTQAVCLKQDLPAVLELFADVVLHPAFPEDEWTKMQPRLLAAIDRQTDSWHGELRHYFRPAYYADHPWSQSPLGRRSVVGGLTATDLRNAYRQRLGASQSVLAIFGDVDTEEVVALVGTLFANMPRRSDRPFKLKLPVDPTSELRVERTNKRMEAVQIGFGPGVSRNSKDYAAIEVLARVFSRFPTGWLDRALRGEEGGLVYAVYCGQSAGLVPGYIYMVFNALSGNLVEALDRTAEVVERARSELVDDQRLADAKAAVLTSEFFGKQSNSDRAAQAALDEMYGLGLDESETFMREVQQLTAEQLRRVARAYLRNPVVVTLSHEDLSREALEAAVDHLEPGRLQITP